MLIVSSLICIFCCGGIGHWFLQNIAYHSINSLFVFLQADINVWLSTSCLGATFVGTFFYLPPCIMSKVCLNIKQKLLQILLSIFLPKCYMNIFEFRVKLNFLTSCALYILEHQTWWNKFTNCTTSQNSSYICLRYFPSDIQTIFVSSIKKVYKCKNYHGEIG